jgi:hypothetical protein
MQKKRELAKGKALLLVVDTAHTLIPLYDLRSHPVAIDSFLPEKSWTRPV